MALPRGSCGSVYRIQWLSSVGIIKRGKYVSVRASSQERFTRIKTLSDDYTEESIIKRSQSKSRPFPFKMEDRNKGMIIDMDDEKIQASPGLHRYDVKHNLSEASSSLLHLQSSGYKSFEEIDEALDTAMTDFEETRDAITSIEDEMRKLSVVMETVDNYKNTKDIHDAYKKSKNPEKFLRGHETEIMIYETASKHLQSMGYAKLPKMEKLQAQY